MKMENKMEHEVQPLNVLPLVKPIAVCCGTILLGRNVKNRVVGVDVNHDTTKDKYYVICPTCECYQFIDSDEIKDLIEEA